MFALRFYSRLTRNGFQLWADDWIMVAGYITVVATQIIVTYMISILTRPEKVVWARVHQNLQTIALGLTKTSFGVTLLRLMPEGWQHKLIILLLVTMNLQFLAHAFATWQKICLVPDRWTYPGDHCWTLDQNLTFSLFSACKCYASTSYFLPYLSKSTDHLCLIYSILYFLRFCACAFTVEDDF